MDTLPQLLAEQRKTAHNFHFSRQAKQTTAMREGCPPRLEVLARLQSRMRLRDWVRMVLVMSMIGMIYAASIRKAAVITVISGMIILPPNPLMKRHPIESLIEEGSRRWEEQDTKRRKTRTLEAAYNDYVAAFGMRPPEGFEDW